MLNKIATALACAMLMFGAPGRATAAVEVKLADNVFVVPDPKAKVITLWMIVHAGCRDEEGGRCRGLSHYLEHLMFLGRDGEHNTNNSLFFAAGQTNAYTTMMATAYYQSVPAREDSVPADLEKLFALFADRLRELNPPAEAANRERNVVLQEFNYRRSDSFRVRFNNDVNALMLPGHPYSEPVIGAKEDIAAYTIERAREFHQKWYAKNNAKFVVYGPVTPETVRDLAAKYIDPLPEKAIPSRSWLDTLRSFQPMDGAKRDVDAELKRPEVQFEKIVRFEEPFPAQSSAVKSILFDYLNSQISGSLSDVIVEDKKLASRVDADRSSIGSGAMWFTTHATLEEGVAPEAVKQSIADYYLGLAAKGFDAKVVERLKKRRLTDIAETGKDPKKVLSSLTNWFSENGDYKDWQKRGERLVAVTAGDFPPLLRAMAEPGRQLFGIMAPVAGGGVPANSVEKAAKP